MNSDDIQSAFSTEMEILEIKGLYINIKEVESEIEFNLDELKDLKEELQTLQDEIAIREEIIENLQKNRKVVDPDEREMFEIEDNEDVISFVEDDQTEIKNQCLLVINLYNQFLKSNDSTINEIVAELRNRLESFTSFDSTGVATLSNVDINFHNYSHLGICDPLYKLMEYVENLAVS